MNKMTEFTEIPEKKSLYIFATIYPKEESFSMTKELLEGIIDNTRNEDGCIEFILHQDLEIKRLYLYEQWRDEEALSKHFTYKYTIDMIDEFASLLEKETDIIKMVNIK